MFTLLETQDLGIKVQVWKQSGKNPFIKILCNMCLKLKVFNNLRYSTV